MPGKKYCQTVIMDRRPILFGLGIVTAGIIAGCFLQYRNETTNKECTRQLFAMDTVMSFTAYGKNSEQAVDAAMKEVKRLDDLLSTGNPDSEVSQINTRGNGTLSKDTEAILTEAMEIYKETDGLFDVTIYPLMQLWGFPTQKYHVPAESELQEALAKVDASQVVIDGDQVSLGINQEMDLGGIAKGYTSARVMEIFREYGITSGMVSLGGNVQTLNTRPDGKPWQIGIQNPNGQQGSLLAVLSVENKAVITSGGYERYFEEDGNTYIHILNPKTGYPADSGLVSVSVISENGMLADALSTSLYLMGEEQAAGYWRTHADEFDMILETEDGTLYVTEGISQEIQTDNTTIVLNTEE